MQDTITQTEQKLAEDTFSFCIEHMQEHYTIQFLAERAGVSPTKMKNIFRKVYGAPLFSYVRTHKMRLAAHELVSSNSTILNIAETFGYDNASKFSAAFRAVLGVSPQEYRKNVRSE